MSRLPTQDQINAIFASDAVSEVTGWISALKKGKFLSEFDMRDLLQMATNILEEEDTLLRLSPPITVCGDIHGQFWDLLELFQTGGEIPQTRYLFLGDIVDRGKYGLECLTLLLALKVVYPNHIYILRGNHESSSVSQVYGFYDECVTKYGDSSIWKACLEVFQVLPLSAVIGSEIFCVHGGLSPDCTRLDEIQDLSRMKELPSSGIMADLLWSDPEDYVVWEQSPRGCGWLFGIEPTKQFLFENDLNLITRAHQLVTSGYKYWFDGLLVTVWSAPNYCNRCGNMAAILHVDEYHTISESVFLASKKTAVHQEEEKIEINYFL